ncbi:MAG: biopolymer transporter ExbD [candidate division WOR-3 bacterium]|jgi:biopolymer transport protein ExbD
MAVRVNFPKREIPNVPLISLANLGFIIAIFLILVVKIEKTFKTESISLPISNSSFKLIGQKYVLNIVILSDNEIYVEGSKLRSLNDLEYVVNSRKKKDLTVFIKADKNIKVSTYFELIDKLRSLGISKVALITGG